MDTNTSELARQRPGASKIHAGADRGDRWVVRIPWRPASVLDARTTHRKPDGRPITGRERLLLLILEGSCRSRCYCWTSNQELADAYGCGPRALQLILREMEDDKLIHRVIEGRGSREVGGMQVRVGIILLRRVDPDLPVADPAAIDDVVALMRAAISFHRAQENAPPRAQEIAPGEGARNCARIKKEVFEEDEVRRSSSSGPSPKPACDPGAPAAGSGSTTTIPSTSGGGDGGEVRQIHPGDAVAPERAEALAAAEVAFGAEVAAKIRAEVPRIERKIRTDPVIAGPTAPIEECIVLAIFLAAALGKKGVRKPANWVRSTAVNFATVGPSDESREARAESRRLAAGGPAAVPRASPGEVTRLVRMIKSLECEGFEIRLEADSSITVTRGGRRALPEIDLVRKALLLDKNNRPAIVEYLKARSLGAVAPG